jgi:hypothetical protein
MNEHDGWSWGKSRKRADGWQNKLSQTRKRLFMEGKLKSPTEGRKRPWLSERNRKYGWAKKDKKTNEGKPRIFTREYIQDLFEKYRTFSGGIRGFAKLVGHSTVSLREAFHKFIPSDELDLVMESKKGRNTQYAIGRRFEWRVRDHFKEKGYFVLRSPRSSGPVDLVAIKKGEVLFIQCKTNGRIPLIEKEKIVELAKSVGAKPLLVWRGMQPHYPLKIELIS